MKSVPLIVVSFNIFFENSVVSLGHIEEVVLVGLVYLRSWHNSRFKRRKYQ